MQVILLPRGSGPSRNLKFSLKPVCALVATVLLALVAAGAYLGYRIGQGPGADRPVHPAVVRQAVLERDPVIQAAACERTESRLDMVSSRKLTHLKTEIDAEKQKLEESRQRVGDQLDSLGQRLGQIQAQVSRLNALGQQLTDMAGLDPDEFSFDSPPAMGGPEHPAPWVGIHEPELSQSMDMIEISLNKKERELQALEALLTDRELHKMQYPQGWPAHGWVSSGYGYRTDPFTGRRAFHDGVDIAAPVGTPIHAMAAGVVSFAGHRPGYGLVVEINHGNGYKTRYAHASKLIAKVGERVEKGDTVALVGSTGRSTGSHLHVEVLKNGDAVNPRKYLISTR